VVYHGSVLSFPFLPFRPNVETNALQSHRRVLFLHGRHDVLPPLHAHGRTLGFLVKSNVLWEGFVHHLCAGQYFVQYCDRCSLCVISGSDYLELASPEEGTGISDWNFEFGVLVGFVPDFIPATGMVLTDWMQCGCYGNPQGSVSERFLDREGQDVPAERYVLGLVRFLSKFMLAISHPADHRIACN